MKTKLLSITLLISGICSFANIHAQCLMADYKFSGNAADSSGNGHHATVNGATLTTDRFGTPNSAYQFNGTGNYIDTQTSFDYQDRTVSAWAYADTITSLEFIVDQDAKSLSYGAFAMVMKNGNEIGANPGGANISSAFCTGVQQKQWYHIVLVRSASNAFVYVNGNLKATTTPTSNGSVSSPNPQMVIGTYRGKSNYFFHGKIDDVKIYNCALDSNQVKGLYTQVEEVKDINFKVYPNPMKDYTTIQFDNPSNETFELILTDASGKIVRRKQVATSKATINRNNMATGTYFYQLRKDNQIYVRGKLFIQ